MDKHEYLKRNIRSLRIAHGETLEELGEIINSAPSAIGNYEAGIRKPNDYNTIFAIANHYRVTVDDLLSKDLTAIDEIKINIRLLLGSFDTIFPIFSSPDSLGNNHFKKTYRSHQAIYEDCKKDDSRALLGVENCFIGYDAALASEKSKQESAANILALYYFLIMTLKGNLELKNGDNNNPPAAYNILLKDNPQAKRIISRRSSDFYSDLEQMLKELIDSEMVEYISQRLIQLKKDPRWADLADYYLALHHFCVTEDEEEDVSINLKIGMEMLYDFALVKNPYSTRFLKLLLDISTD